jgi:hypothetical protein
MVSVLAVNTVEGMFDPWPVQIKEDIVVVIDIFFLVWQLNLQIPIQSVCITTKVEPLCHQTFCFGWIY